MRNIQYKGRRFATNVIRFFGSKEYVGYQKVTVIRSVKHARGEIFLCIEADHWAVGNEAEKTSFQIVESEYPTS